MITNNTTSSNLTHIAHTLRQFNQDHIADNPDLIVQLLNSDYFNIFLSKPKPISTNIQPCSYIPYAHNLNDPQRLHAKKIGELALRQSRLCVLTVAGGQGTRLNFDGPKGCLPVTPIKNKSLFQLFAEKIRAAEIKYSTSIPWIIMTSDSNHQRTQDFIDAHHNWGLSQIFIIEQNQVPVTTLDNQFIVDNNNRIVQTPDGHGGVYCALAHLYPQLLASGKDLISYFQIDNPLVNPLDPIFIGHHLLNHSQISSKIVKKRSPSERVGVFCQINSIPQIIEYIDLPKNFENTLNLANIAVHLIDTSFAQKMSTIDFPYHSTHRLVQVNDEKVNCKKFEKFVFDAIPLAQNAIVYEVLRSQEFSPIKNASGEDTLLSAQAAQIALHQSWLTQAGITNPPHNLEISPLFADNLEDFLLKFDKNTFDGNPYIS